MKNIITEICLKNFRGITGQLELSQRTLIVGPNGAGKSAYIAGANFAIQGVLPGYKTNENIKNASGDEMAATVVINDHTIGRKLVQGKTLSESVNINGNWAKGKGGNDRIRDILGVKPVLLNMPRFFACTDTEKRRMVLGMYCEQDRLEELMKEEEKRRKAKNSAVDTRKACDKAVDELIQQMAEMEKPTGNLAHLKKEKLEKDGELDEVKLMISTGTANDEARKTIEEAIANIPKLEKDIEKAKSDMLAMEGAAEELAGSIEDHNSKRPTADDVSVKVVLPEAALLDLQDILDRIDRVIETGLNDMQYKLLKEARDELFEYFPDEDAVALYDQESKTWALRKDELNAKAAEIKAAVAGHVGAVDRLTGELKAAKQNEGKHKNIGPGLDRNNVATRAGIETRIAELNAKIAPLEKIATLEQAAEKARIKANEALDAEEAAKVALQEAEEEQRTVVEEASDMLAVRSKELLPSGNLRIEPTEKGIDIFWAMDKERKISRTTLSGFEQAVFDAALGHALAPEAVIMIEAAEIDASNLWKFMQHTNESDFQIILASWYLPEGTPPGWEMKVVE